MVYSVSHPLRLPALSDPSPAFVHNSILSRLSPVAAVARQAWQIDSILDARLADNSMDPLPEAGFSLIFFSSSNQDRLEVGMACLHTHTHTHNTTHAADPGVETEAETVDK